MAVLQFHPAAKETDSLCVIGLLHTFQSPARYAFLCVPDPVKTPDRLRNHPWMSDRQHVIDILNNHHLLACKGGLQSTLG